MKNITVLMLVLMALSACAEYDDTESLTPEQRQLQAQQKAREDSLQHAQRKAQADSLYLVVSQLPASDTDGNYQGYRELVRLQPSNKEYRDKVEYYRTAVDIDGFLENPDRFFLNNIDARVRSADSGGDLLRLVIVANASKKAIYDQLEIAKQADLAPIYINRLQQLERRIDEHIETLTRQIRPRYVSLMSDALWRENIDVKLSGRTIKLIGGMFFSNANIEDIHKIIREQLCYFGFTRAEYHPYEGSEYIYYTITQRKTEAGLPICPK